VVGPPQTTSRRSILNFFQIFLDFFPDFFVPRKVDGATTLTPTFGRTGFETQKLHSGALSAPLGRRTGALKGQTDAQATRRHRPDFIAALDLYG
jgi:hypothetical protein